MKLQFNELDFALFKNAKTLYNAYFANLNNCIYALEHFRDDLLKDIEGLLGASKKWTIKKSTNNTSAFPSKRGGKFDLEEFYLSQEIELKREKAKEGFFLNVEYTYDSEEFDTTVFWWQMGQSREHIAEDVLFDDVFLARLKANATKAGAKAYTYNQDANEGLQTIFIAMPTSEVVSEMSILDQHRLFKKSIVKPMFNHIRKAGLL